MGALHCLTVTDTGQVGQTGQDGWGGDRTGRAGRGQDRSAPSTVWR